MYPKVSIILPVYNVEKSINKCVESIVKQTFKEIEIIIINDGSSDGTRNIIEKLSSLDERIIIVNQRNTGVGGARNKGLDMAQGEYCLFIDGDDYINPVMVEVMYKMITKFKCDVVQCSYNIITNDNVKNIKYDIPFNKVITGNEIESYLKRPLILGNLSTYIWDKIYNVEFLKKNQIKFEDKIIFEDWYFNMDIISKMSSFLYIEDNLYNYVVYDESLSKKNYDNYDEMIIDLQEKKYKFMTSWGMNTKEYTEQFYLSIGNDILKIINYIYNKEKSFTQRIKRLNKLSRNKFLVKNFYLDNYKIFINRSSMNKLYSRALFYGLKYKNVFIIHLLKLIR